MDADAQLPSGTVTFLFTDIEGSTALIEELGEERYVEALGEHRRVLRAARHEDGRGAELLGAGASLREEIERGLDSEVLEQLHDQAVADARAALGEEAFAAAWARGPAMTLTRSWRSPTPASGYDRRRGALPAHDGPDHGS